VQRLRAFENRVLRRIYGPKREEMSAGWRRLHNEELHKLYSSSYIIRVIKSRRMMKWAGHVAWMGMLRIEDNSLFRKCEGKTALRRPRRRW
jgi:hypothetical protein